MSAYICSPEHIKSLAAFAAHRRPNWGFRVSPRYLDGATHYEPTTTRDLATYYAAVLYEQNVRSVAERYPGDDFDDLPGPLDKPYSLEFDDDRYAPRMVTDPVALLKMADALEYQSCETDDYQSTLAYRLLNAIRRACIKALPGYEEAPWDYYDLEMRERGERAA